MDILLIKNNVVDLVISANSLEDVVPYYPDHYCMISPGNISAGYIYSNGTLAPGNSNIVQSGKYITRFAFLTRFTDMEAIAIDMASTVSSIEGAAIRRMQKKIDSANYIDLSDLGTLTGVNMLSSMGLLTQDRASEILYSPIQAKELYT